MVESFHPWESAHARCVRWGPWVPVWGMVRFLGPGWEDLPWVVVGPRQVDLALALVPTRVDSALILVAKLAVAVHDSQPWSVTLLGEQRCILLHQLRAPLDVDQELVAIGILHRPRIVVDLTLLGEPAFARLSEPHQEDFVVPRDLLSVHESRLFLALG